MHLFFNAFGGGVHIIEELFITPNKTAAATCAAAWCVRLQVMKQQAALHLTLSIRT